MPPFILSLLGLVLGDPLKGIEDSLVQAHKDALAAGTDEAKLEADVRIKSLETQLAALHETMAIRAQTAGFPEVRALFFWLGSIFTGHLTAICIGSTLAGALPAANWLLHVAALPAPIDQYEGLVVGFFFGSAVVMNVGQSIAGALARRG